MPHFHRYYLANHPIFITCVTNKRMPYLKNEESLCLFWEILKIVQKLHPFHLQSYVILPDHFHWIMQLPENEPNFSAVLHSIKNNFTRLYKEQMGIPKAETYPIWQKRFWDHIIRNKPEYQNLFDYIHWNPIKHGYVTKPEDWPQSSFRFWCDRGIYPPDWGWWGSPIENINLDIE